MMSNSLLKLHNADKVHQAKRVLFAIMDLSRLHVACNVVVVVVVVVVCYCKHQFQRYFLEWPKIYKWLWLQVFTLTPLGLCCW